MKDKIRLDDGILILIFLVRLYQYDLTRSKLWSTLMFDCEDFDVLQSLTIEGSPVMMRHSAVGDDKGGAGSWL